MKHFTLCTPPHLDQVGWIFCWIDSLFRKFVFKKPNVFLLKRKLKRSSFLFRIFVLLLNTYWEHCQTSMMEIFLQNHLKEIDVWQVPKCDSVLLYDLGVCHRDAFNTCFPRVIRPSLTNNMVLFSANGTNCSMLSRGDGVVNHITLSEAVQIFSTRLSEFYVSTVFLLHCKKHLSWMWTNLFIKLKGKESLLFVILIIIFKYW